MKPIFAIIYKNKADLIHNLTQLSLTCYSKHKLRALAITLLTKQSHWNGNIAAPEWSWYGMLNTETQK